MTTAVSANTSQTPGGRSLAEMQRLVLSYVQAPQDDPELNDTARGALNIGIDIHNSRNWFKIQSYQDMTLVTGTSDYSLAPDVKDPRAAEWLDSSGNPSGRLEYKPLKTFLIEHPSSTSNGSPSVYTIMYSSSRLLVLDLAPDSSFVSQYPTLRFHYHRRVPHLVGASDFTGLSAEHDAWLVWYARSEMAAIRGVSTAGFAFEQQRMLMNALKMDDAETMTDWSSTS